MKYFGLFYMLNIKVLFKKNVLFTKWRRIFLNLNKNSSGQDEFIDDSECSDDEKILNLTELNNILFDKEEIVTCLISHDVLTKRIVAQIEKQILTNI